MNPSSSPTEDRTTIDQLLALEHERCEAIAAHDLATLRRLLSPRLVHVHTRGNQDTLDSYLAYIGGKVQVLKVDRQNLQVALHGDCAVMTGGQVNTARLRNSDKPSIQVTSQVMQVWVREGGAWQLVAFQATPTGEPPPAVAH